MAVTPNRRGEKSRAVVLDAAERVMAAEGFEAATIARVVEESGAPLSSVYHYFGSTDGALLAVMERGVERFFADLPEPDRRTGRPADHLRMIFTTAVLALERHPTFSAFWSPSPSSLPTPTPARSMPSSGECGRSRSVGCAHRSPSRSRTTRRPGR
jgi:AcrR family transcriptional regulator